VVMIESGAVALSGPSVVESAISEKLDDAALGGPEAATAAGNVHMVVQTEADAMAAIAAFLSFLPANASLPAPVAPVRAPVRDPDDLAEIVPIETRIAYDMNHLLEALVDEGSLFPWGAGWGPSLICALARIDGQPVGVIANQPMVMAGAMDPAALTKEHDFVSLCDNFNLPLVFLHDVPGLLIGTQAERAGILRAYERLVSRIADAQVPKVGVVIRKAYGGGHFAMGGRPTHPDFLFAWPNAEMGFMAPDTGVRTVYRRKLQAVLQAEGQDAHDRLLAELTDAWTLESEPWEAAAHLSLDDIIEPAQTRHVIARALELAWGMRPRARAR
jgi:methylmalonyl-CoA decarboxylase subunit alpha